MKSKLKKAMQSLYHYFSKFLSVLLTVSVVMLPLTTSVSAADIYVPNYRGVDSWNNYLKHKDDVYKEYTNLSEFPTGFPYSNYDLMHQKLIKEFDVVFSSDRDPLIERFPDGFKPHYMYMFSYCNRRNGDNSEIIYDVDNYSVIYTENQLVYDTTLYSTPGGTSDIAFRATGKFLHYKIDGNYLDKFFKKMTVSSTNDPKNESNLFNPAKNGPWFVHNGSSKILDISGNPLDLNVDGYFDPEGDDYRKQTSLERYSNYTIERYPNANPLQKFNGWYTRPEQAYNDDKVVKMGGNSAFKHLYFGESPSNTNILSLKGSYFTYHLYFWDGLAWAKRSIWISRPLEFVPSGASGDGMPQLACQPLSSVVIVDYRSSQISMSAKIVSYNKMYDLFQGSTVKRYYLINDDSKVKEDTSGSNHGTVTTDNNNNYLDDSGTIVEKPNLDIEIEGSNDNGGFFSGIIDWFQSVFDGIASIFQTIGNGFGSVVGSCGDFFAFLGSAFSFLPTTFWAIIGVGVAVLVALRILGR